MARLIGNKVSGEIASFETENTIPINTAKFSFLPKQEGDGTPSLENVRNISGWNGIDVYRAGKNIAHIVGYTATTINSPLDTRESSNPYGTSLSTTNFTLPDTPVVITQSSYDTEVSFSHYRNGYFAVIVDNLEFGKRYNLSFRVINITSNPLNASLTDWVILNSRSTTGVGATKTVNGDKIVMTNFLYEQNTAYPNRQLIYIYICGMSFTLSEFMVTPVEETDQTWEPYCGEKIHVDFPGVGKNLFDISEMATRTGVTVDGNTFSGTPAAMRAFENGRGREVPIFIPAGTTVTASCKAYKDNDENNPNYQTGAGFGLFFMYEDGTEVRLFYTRNSAISETEYSGTITTEQNVVAWYYSWYNYGSVNTWHVSNMQIEIGSSATSYEPFKNTIYGGYVDLVNGEVVSEWEFTSGDWGDVKTSTINSTTNLQQAIINFSNQMVTLHNASDYGTNTISNINGKVMWEMSNILPEHYFGSVSPTPRIYLFLPSTTPDDLNIQVAAKLATPIHYPLVPLSCSTMSGKNNIWCIDGTSEIAYSGVFEDLMDYRRKILLNSPHLESDSASLVNFRTDMRAKLKECKAYFSQVQSGSGDPSPSNVRNFEGFTNVNVYHARKNLANIVGYSATTSETLVTSNNYGTVINTTNYSLPDTACVVTQNTYTTDYEVNHYKNGFIVVHFDDKALEFEKQYKISFRITNITSDPFNNGISRNIVSPYGNGAKPTIIDGDKLIYNIQFRKSANHDRQYIYIRCCGMSFTLSEFMVTSVDETDFTFEPFVADIHSVNFEPYTQTFYGGYVDFVNGEIVAEWGIKTIGDLTWYYDGSYNRFDTAISDIKQYSSVRTTPFYASSFVTIDDGRAVSSVPNNAIYGAANSINVYIKSTDYSTVRDFKNAYGTQQFAYPLETPIHYPITPSIIRSLNGTNNIWSDTNGDVDVKWWTHSKYVTPN